jgi:hypothetical protein
MRCRRENWPFFFFFFFGGGGGETTLYGRLEVADEVGGGPTIRLAEEDGRPYERQLRASSIILVSGFG